MNRKHTYNLDIKWTGNKGTGTSSYSAYERSHTILAEGKNEIAASSDQAFRGDKTKHNPEELLIASISSCHMLSYLHVCAVAGIIVVDYSDHATGIMEETPDGGGRFTEVKLNPVVTVTQSSMIDLAIQLHKKANQLCFIANSVNFKVAHFPLCKLVAPD